MAKSKSTSDEKNLWLPINFWNLNELFTTESISPISFYEERNFGNPVNRNQEAIEDTNNLILFNDNAQSPIILKLSNFLLDLNCLTEIKSNKKNSLKSYHYPKTIYLKKGFFNVCFTSELKLNEFLSIAFMLLEVKTTNKYKSDFIVTKTIPEKIPFYQTQLITDKTAFQPFYDKAFNQIKGLIYGYLIGTLGTLDEKEQNLISNLSKLQNTIGGIHTDIVLSDRYSDIWLIKIRKQIKDFQKSYFENIGKLSDFLDTLLLRLEEIDKLNKMRCDELSKQKSSTYKKDYEIGQEALEKTKRALYQFEYTYELNLLREELEKIKQEEKRSGALKGKTREYFKKGTEEYDRKNRLKKLISNIEKNEKYQILKREVFLNEEKLRNFQFGFTQFDTSITEQFSRISEYLYEITQDKTHRSLSEKGKSNIFPDISFEIDISKLANFYCRQTKEYTDFSVILPAALAKGLNEAELQLICVAVNSIFSKPQGRLGNFSEQNILETIKDIGEHLPENSFKQILRDYYKYRIGKNDSFTFPENSVIANLVIFFIKLNGHDQINKMIIKKNVNNRQIAFLLYGAYLGFANMPKTFTNIVFDSENTNLFRYVDNYLFTNYINLKL